jgi:hypothetical protein
LDYNTDYFCTWIFDIVYYLPLWLCALHLCVYILRSEKKEVLTFIYAGFVIYFLYKNNKHIDVIAIMYDEVLKDGSLTTVNFHYWQLLGIKIAGYSVMSAFLCNFSKALYTLHSLDHGIYNEKSEWYDARHKSSFLIKSIDFSLRLVIAYLFIKMEFLLHEASDKNPVTYFREISWFGIKLYSCLLVWAGFTHAKFRLEGMKIQYIIALCGLFNSCNILYMTTYTEDVSTILFFVFFTFPASCCLIFYVYKYFYSNFEKIIWPSPAH